MKGKEKREKEREFQLRMREIEMQERANQPKQKIEYNFDVTKHIRLVPPFQEKEVDKYFLHFEKVAENLNWPKEHWTLFLQSVLIGKAREIYTQLGVEQSHHYETVKELILKGYELVPEAYRQKFRNCKKDSNQTHVEFARNKEQLFDRWCCSKKIDQNYDKLRQLVLVEEFKRCIQSDVKTFLDEKQLVWLMITTLHINFLLLLNQNLLPHIPKINLCLVIHLACPVNPTHPNPILLVKPKVNIPYLDPLVTIVRNLVTLFLNV